MLNDNVNEWILIAGIQEYLFENGRIDNIFTDMYYEPFTSSLHEVIKDFKLPINEMGYFVTRIEEEHLWECKQLGAHSPQVLLNTLIYFNAKYFMMKTNEDHAKLSFSHIMKHWKKGGTATPATKHPPAPGEKRSTLLRYYPPAHLKGKRIFIVNCINLIKSANTVLSHLKLWIAVHWSTVNFSRSRWFHLFGMWVNKYTQLLVDGCFIFFPKCFLGHTMYLYFYFAGARHDDRKCFEQQEMPDNPLRCPVKLYEFYLSHW